MKDDSRPLYHRCDSRMRQSVTAALDTAAFRPADRSIDVASYARQNTGLPPRVTPLGPRFGRADRRETARKREGDDGGAVPFQPSCFIRMFLGGRRVLVPLLTVLVSGVGVPLRLFVLAYVM